MRVPALLRAVHPGPSVAVTLVGAGLAAASGRGLAMSASVLITVLLGQLSVGWSNDAIDAGRDAASGRGDKPIASGDVSRGLVFGLAVAAAVGSAVTALLVGGQGIFHIVAVAVAWSYNYPLKKTMFSVLPYAVSFGLLVAYADAHPQPAMVGAAALLGTAAHFANVLSDLDDDAETGVRGLPHRLGATASQFVTAVALLGSGVIAGYHIDTLAGPAIMVLSGGLAAVVPALRPGRTVFRIVMVTALIDVAALLAAVAG